MAPPDIEIHHRSQSISSGGLMSPPLLVTPEPEYIAAAAGSQIVTNDRESQAETWYDQNGIQPSGEGARVSQPALRLVNRFLDQLLFSFLSGARSISLTSLRPAVSEVLKPKLAHGAISGADQELHEYLGDGDDAQIMAYHNDNGLDADGDWDLELVWKRTRLRCMVYSSLGDMEEEDEDIYMQQEHLGAGSNGPNAGDVSPAVAIFLTSILEFIGEQILVVAGQAAYQRMKAKYEKEAREGTGVMTEIADRIVVEDSDVEKVALDRTLGRLWRSYKKRVRSPTPSGSLNRSFSQESLQTQLARQANNLSPEDETDEPVRRPSLAAVLEYEYAAAIPLPTTNDDVREIEIPGLAEEIEDDSVSDASTTEEETLKPRPKSMLFFGEFPLTPTSDGEAVDSLPVSRKRSHSLPTPNLSPYGPSKRLKSKDSEGSAGGEAKKSKRKDESATTGVVAGVVAAGAAAAAGIVSVVQGKAPQTEIDTKSEIDSDDEEPEEAVILTARMSVGGGSPSDPVGLSRGSSIRSRSGHSSVRVIEVSRTPSLSRRCSVQGDRIGSRPTSINVPVSAGTQSPRVASPMTRGGSNRSSLDRKSSIGNAHSSEESIIEEKEAYESEGDLDTSIPAELAAAMQGVDVGFSPSHQQPNPLMQHPIKEPAPFKLSAAPVPRKAVARSPTKDQISGSLQLNSNQYGFGVPSLTPLREMMEGAPDTSDEASSMAPSYDTFSIRTSHQPSSLNPANRIVESEKPLRALNTNIPRAPSTYSAEVSRKRSASVQKSPHHSASGSDAASHKYLARRTSEEGSIAESKGQSFDELIRSDTTIQYTLTPENSPDSPHGNGSIKGNAQESTRPETSRSGSSVNKYMAALRSNPVEGNRVVNKSASVANIGSKLRPNAPQPRDARTVDRDSIGDFAEFIRSTGPANSYEQAPRVLHSHRGANGTPRNYSGAVSRTTTPANLPRRAESSAGRLKLQARDAAVPRGDSISDLIDFVRAGPQVDLQGGHRIPRTVAPFRTTMDSDQMVLAAGGKAIDANLAEPRSSQASNSVQSSVTSQSGLLKNAAMNKPLPATHHNDFDEPDMMPKRKTRRVRDPYAIEYSDEEEEDYNPTPKPTMKEESLADFLRNVPPPPSPPQVATSSVFDSVPEPPRKDIKKKSSTTALISRFGRRNTDAPPVPKPKISSSPPQVLQKPRTANGAVQKPKTSSGPESRSTSKHGVNTNAPVIPNLPTPSEGDNHASQADSSRTRVPKKTYQPRDAVAMPMGRSTDLADFLMSHEPPPRAATQPLILTSPTLTSPKEESSTFQRMFGRKKVH
ncbi:hypothetical protein HYALB_00010840 [Hymenoscyphus albidus]|uniref:Flo11 n=1 Tax=Hymenoscyphus albidus TaxID=595503 RepID=A0A9N9Q2S6_9HELO|nr:hypothetical protein HYALB_00010840 [Hymenoscyphus albidus]